MHRTKLFTFAALLSGAIALTGCIRENLTTDSDGINPRNVVSSIRIQVSEDLAARLEEVTGEDGIVSQKGIMNADVSLHAAGIESMRRTFPYAGKFEARTRAEGMHLWYDLKFSDKSLMTKAGTELSSIEGITAVENRKSIIRPKYTVNEVRLPATRSEQGIFDDPGLAKQWHYYNDGSYKGIEGCDINVFPVWERGMTGNKDVIVCVTDGGVDYDHEDLAANMWVNEAELNGQPGVDDDGNGYVDDVHGFDFVRRKVIIGDDHGTHVAGTIAAVNNNGIGVCGVAGGNAAEGTSGVKIMTCQIFIGDWEVGDSSEALKYGADNGAVISQNSYGYENGSTIFESDKRAIDYFIKYAGIDENGNQTGPMKGGIVIFAAGNDNTPYGSPSMYEGAFAVSALAADFERAYYSNYGEWCDIAAPGGDAYKNELILSSINGNKYGTMQGTSMACPHVSGVAALIVSQYGGPGFTNEDLKKMLTESANPIIYDRHNSRYQNKLGVGLVDAAKAINGNSKIAPDPVTTLSAEITDVTVATLKWAVPADEDNGIPDGFNIYYSESEFSQDINRRDLPEGITKVRVRIEDEMKAGDTFTARLELPQQDKQYYISVDAYDISMNLSQMSETICIRTGVNKAPVISAPIPEIRIFKAGYITDIDLNRHFADDGVLNYTLADLVQDIYTSEITGNTLRITAVQNGSSIVKVRATDRFGESVTASAKVVVYGQDIDFVCYPNPFTTGFSIKTSSQEEQQITIVISDPYGKTVYELKDKISNLTPVKVDASELKSGEYAVSITTEDGNSTRQNIFKL